MGEGTSSWVQDPLSARVHLPIRNQKTNKGSQYAHLSLTTNKGSQYAYLSLRCEIGLICASTWIPVEGWNRRAQIAT